MHMIALTSQCSCQTTHTDYAVGTALMGLLPTAGTVGGGLQLLNNRSDSDKGDDAPIKCVELVPGPPHAR